MRLVAPYTVTYKGIYAIVGDDAGVVELVEESQCYGASAWARYHLSKGPLVLSSRSVGNMMRYLLKVGEAEFELVGSRQAAGIEKVAIKDNEVEIIFNGLGGGGVGATVTRAHSPGVLRFEISESGGGRKARGRIVLPRRERVLIGVDDTDSKEEGATWALVHNIASQLHGFDSAYLSHALVQLYPVEERTQNCVSTVVEFACTCDGARQRLVEGFKELLECYSVSEETGMVVFSGFKPAGAFEGYSRRVRGGRVGLEEVFEFAEGLGVEIVMGGRGVIGAMAAIPWFARSDESIRLE
jgi:methanogenesis imperfect marker protein 11